MTSSLVQPHLDGLLTFIDDQPHLLGSRCTECATDTFPATRSCPCCGGQAVAPVTLATHGTVWTWTVQRFAPKPPFRVAQPYEPFTVAYVDLGTVRVESRLLGKPVDRWKIGDPVQLVAGPLDPRGSDWQAFWFEPAKEGV